MNIKSRVNFQSIKVISSLKVNFSEPFYMLNSFSNHFIIYFFYLSMKKIFLNLYDLKFIHRKNIYLMGSFGY